MIRSLSLLLIAFLALNVTSCSTTSRKPGSPASLSVKPVDLPSALAAAETAIKHGLDTDADRLAYAEAVKQVVLLWEKEKNDLVHQQSSVVAGGGITYELKVVWPDELRFDELIPDLPLENRKFGRNVEREGVGASFVAHWKRTPERKAQEPFMSEIGYASPITATVDFHAAGGKRRVATLRLDDPRAGTSVEIGGKEHILAGDFSAVGEWLGTVAKKQKLGMSGLGAMMKSANNLDKLGLIALEPPSKNRIPLILVHGLMSRPMTWNNAVNELSLDPVLRKNYQIFLFRYPTGVPVLFSATKFREHLESLHKELSRIGNHRAANHMVLVGHSMGGMLSRVQVQDSGDLVWKAVLGATPDQLNLTKEDRVSLGEYLEFHPNPYVDRVIFICSPHRGSKLAVGFVGAVGRRLIKLPGTILGGTLHILQGDGLDNSAAKKILAKGMPSSIDNLSPKSQFVRISNQLPVKKGLHVHSIIGNKDGRPLNDPKCSDGVVPYTSAHLDYAESELIVRSDHGAHEKSEAIEEVHRILLLHLKQLSR